MQEPEITDTELDEMEAGCNEVDSDNWPTWRSNLLRLIKALRACCQQCEMHRQGAQDAWDTADTLEQQSKAKDAALKLFADEANWTEWLQTGSSDPCEIWDLERRFDLPPQEIALAALDNLPSVAKQGETDDAE